MGRKGKKKSMEESGRVRRMRSNKKRKKMRFGKSEEGEIGYLPSDVLSDVLSRLPAKTLSRFKCVSKGWHNLIKDDNFVQRHLIRSTENGKERFLRVIFRWYSKNFHSATAMFYKLEQGEDVYKVTKVGKVIPFVFPSLPPSCNGLLCYMSSRDFRIRVCNPITRGTITLPKPNFLAQKRVTDLQDLGLKLMLGFGYVSSDKKYKVMVAWSTPTDSDVEILTLGGTKSSSSWRPVSSKQYGLLLRDFFSIFSAPAYADGALYWYLTESHTNKHGDPSNIYPSEIISFDFAEEKFNLIPVPQDVNRFKHVCWICELQGHLCLLSRPQYGPTAKMWMLKKNHEWVTREIPPNLIWSGTFGTNKSGYMSMVTQANNQEKPLQSCVYNFKGELVEPAKLHRRLHKYDFEVGQFHQESLVSLTNK